MPKYMINASGHQFFHPNGSQFYYADLPEEKHLRYVPNAKHNLEGSDETDSMIAFYQAIIAGKPRPRFSWKKEKNGSLVVSVVDKPTEVNLWQATNPAARDFRVDTIGKAYQSTPLKATRSRGDIAKGREPGKGYQTCVV